jgi:glycerol-3-phosphate dehydrogenase (NAD(P)+)
MDKISSKERERLSVLKVAVIGAGSWGTALAHVAAENNNNTYLWVRRRELAEEIIKTGENRPYLPGADISPKINVSTDIKQVVTDADIVIMAVPSQAIRSMARQIRSFVKEDAIITSASKGIEINSLKRMSQVLAEELDNRKSHNIVALSGPSHAEEVIRNLPTAIVAASPGQEAAEKVQDVLINNNFRVYTNTDIIGVELGGALKNVIAICSGISDGLGFGDNTRAALMTRGIVEITRLGVKLGASPETFSGLSGIGDLIVTCSSDLSRNRKAGIDIGRGKTVEEVMQSTNMVIEGINTTRAAFLLSQKHKIEMPITEQAYRVLFKGKDPLLAVNSLMSREGKHEHEDIISQRFFVY